MTDAFIKRTGNRKWGRRLFGVVGHGLCAASYFLAIAVHMGWAPLGIVSAWMFVLPIAFAAFWNDITMGSAWASCLDIGKRYSGIVAGCMNTIGNLGGAVAGWVTGTILEMHLDAHAATLSKGVTELSAAEKVAGQLPGYNINFLVFASVYFLAVFLWLRIDPTKPVAGEEG